jgi:hypothetical protein
MRRLASSKLRDANGVAVTKVQSPSFSLTKLDCLEVAPRQLSIRLIVLESHIR